MDFRRLRKLALVSTVALPLALSIQSANAQTSTTVGTQFTTAAALTSAVGTAMDFGSWSVIINGADTCVLTLLSTLPGPPAVPVVVVPGTSTCVNTIAPAATGTFTVTSPILANLQIRGAIAPNFADPSLTLSVPVYTDTVAANVAIPAAFGVPIVTIGAATVAETVGVGATLTIAGASPAAATVFNDAVVGIDLQF